MFVLRAEVDRHADISVDDLDAGLCICVHSGVIELPLTNDAGFLGELAGT
jgi:hypothetical protein